MSSFQDSINKKLANAITAEDKEQQEANASAKRAADTVRRLVSSFAEHYNGSAPFEITLYLVCHSDGHFFNITNGETRRLSLFNNILRVDTYEMRPSVKKFTAALRAELVPDGFTVGDWGYYNCKFSYDDDNRYTAVTGFDLYSMIKHPISPIGIDPQQVFTDTVRDSRGFINPAYSHTYTQNGKEIEIDFKTIEPHAIISIEFRMG